MTMPIYCFDFDTEEEVRREYDEQFGPDNYNTFIADRATPIFPGTIIVQPDQQPDIAQSKSEKPSEQPVLDPSLEDNIELSREIANADDVQTTRKYRSDGVEHSSSNAGSEKISKVKVAVATAGVVGIFAIIYRSSKS